MDKDRSATTDPSASAESRIPERLARFSALLTERWIRHEVYGTADDPFITVYHDESNHPRLTVRSSGWLATRGFQVPPDSPIATAIVLSREVWHE